VFVATLVGTAAIVVPVPYIAAVVAAGSYLNPITIGLVGGLAAAIGEMTGYIGGMTGRVLLPQNRWTALIERGMLRFGTGVVFIGALVPNPFFDAIGLVAGAGRFPVALFMPACFLGKAIRLALLAAFGSALLGG